MGQVKLSERIEKPVRIVLLALSVLLWAAMSLCYALRPDPCAAVTIWPAYSWLVPGLVLAGLAWRGLGKRVAAPVVLLWLVYLVAFSEETRSVTRLSRWPVPGWHAAVQEGRALRVVSLNCASSKEAAAEVVRYHPDIVLLQESPSQEEAKRLARLVFRDDAAVAWSADTSILARGTITARPVPRLAPFVQGRVRLASGIEAEVFSLRLMPPVARFDLFSPSCWREQAQNRRLRREQVRDIARQIATVPGAVPLIVGGDFNAPAGDAVFRLLKPRLHDSFAEGGIGWGNTATNDTPVSRIDQVWISRHFRAAAVLARTTRHSDHRMVVCDLWLTSPRQAQGPAPTR
jgi:endonuclease/exonuclease/phosphatase (EEP) superfamily protein YafD